MLLPQQIQAILYHLMMGWLYGCAFYFLCNLCVYIRYSLIIGIVEILYHIGFLLLSFYGLYCINGGVTSVYLIGFFIVGVMIFYMFYLPVFMEGFIWFKQLFSPIKKVLIKLKVFIRKKIREKKNAIRKSTMQKKQKRQMKKVMKKKKHDNKNESVRRQQR